MEMDILIKLKLLLPYITTLITDGYKSPYIRKQMGLFKHVWPFVPSGIKGFTYVKL